MTTHVSATSTAVRRALTERGITQAAAAAAIGLSQPALNARLTGITPWRLIDLEELADLLCIPVHELVQPRTEAVAS